MIKLPRLVVTYLPKGWQDKYIERLWDDTPDDDILDAYDDAIDWIELSHNCISPTVKDVAVSCQSKLDNYVLPQMRKRGMEIPEDDE